METIIETQNFSPNYDHHQQHSDTPMQDLDAHAPASQQLPFPTFSQDILDECEDRLRKLEATQHQIVETSEHLLRLSQNESHYIPFIVHIWCRLLLRVNKSKKVALVYLANELIQKSILLSGQNQVHQLSFSKAFQPIIGRILVKLFEFLQKPEYNQIKIDILKVLKVWMQRQLYNVEHLKVIREELMQVGGLTEEDLDSKLPPRSYQDMTKKIEINQQNTNNQQRSQPVQIEEFRGGYDINNNWIELAESLKFLDENRVKIAKLEKELDYMVENLNSTDECDLECKMNEYQSLISLQKTYERDLLKQPLKMYNKVENNNFQEVLTLERIDQALTKVIKQRLSLRK
ncbi:UNKNOWN [Stylonychia lemnae]|uniref:CID domain-containing protein n=1 Tax=Stylonychia lemnae TaxID=5949 RepID=A0A077ZZ58_STYLE|nr:UNKNOWN [Stylonychia lemnae]|eukprot:CDW74498.1 UNKNOWN [Stylonychia lemnae]